MRKRLSLFGLLTVPAVAWMGCADRPADPASIRASLALAGAELVCASPVDPRTTCTITVRLEVSIREEAGRDVYLESVAGALWDIRSMQDMHATPAVLSSEDIRSVAGSVTVPGHGQRSVPYALGFSFKQPSIIGTLKTSVQVRGVDTAGNAIEANCEAIYVPPVR